MSSHNSHEQPHLRGATPIDPYSSETDAMARLRRHRSVKPIDLTLERERTAEDLDIDERLTRFLGETAGEHE